MNSERNSVLYYFFYALFSVDTWRIVIGVIMTAILGPKLTAGRDLGMAGEVVLWVMMTGVGYTIAFYPARAISRGLRRLITRQ